MNPLQVIATLRKFGNYIAGVFPIAAVVAQWLDKRMVRVSRRIRVNRKWRRFSRHQHTRAAWKVLERLYWKNYSKDRINLEESPPEALLILRPVFQLCVLLCLLIPLTQLPLGTVAIETFSGIKSKVPLWSAFLCMISLPCAWGALLSGTAFSNRLAFTPVAVGCSYFLTTCAVMMPRSYANFFLTLAVMTALYVSERNSSSKGIGNELAGLASSVIVGIAAGLQGFVMSPLKPMIVPANFSELSLMFGTIFGITIGVLCHLFARVPQFPLPLLCPNGEVKPGPTMWTITGLLLLYLICATLRGDASKEAGLLVSSIAVTNNFLWPVWYFVGVGIVHKLLGTTKSVTAAVESILPQRLVIPVLVAVFCLCALASRSDELLANFDLNSSQGWFYQAIEKLYSLCKPILWTNPLTSIAVHWVSHILILDLIVITILSVQKRLTNDVTIKLLYLTSLAGLLLWEYLFQLASFSRTPHHSVMVLFLFSVWLLWLMHTSGWSLCLRSSSAFPARGRLAIYAGLVMLALIEIHSRTAAADFKVVNELFLTMFRGIVDIGLPYFLFTWAAKRWQSLPVTAGGMLASFSFGALAGMLLNIMNKLSACHWSFWLFQNVIKTQTDTLMSIGSINTNLQIPPDGLLIQAVAYVTMLILLISVGRRKSKTKGGVESIVFVLAAFAGGVACMSGALLELPLPPYVRALTAPLNQETAFNCNVFVNYLAFWIPSLFMGIAALLPRISKGEWGVVSSLFAVLFNWGIFYFYQRLEPFLRATDSMYYAVATLAGLFVLLIIAAVSVIGKIQSLPNLQLSVQLTGDPRTKDIPPLAQESDAVQLKEIETKDSAQADSSLSDPNSSAAVPASIPMATFVQLILSMEVIFIAAIAYHSYGQFHFVSEPFSSQPLVLRRDWQSVPSSSTAKLPGEQKIESVLFKRYNQATGSPSFLQCGVVHSKTEDPMSLLKELLLRAAQSPNFPNLQPVKILHWDKYHPNALVCHFTYDLHKKDKIVPAAGVSVLLPTADLHRTEYYTIYSLPEDMEKSQWELALLVQSKK